MRNSLYVLINHSLWYKTSAFIKFYIEFRTSQTHLFSHQVSKCFSESFKIIQLSKHMQKQV